MFHLKVPANQEQAKSNINRRKEIIIMYAKVNEIRLKTIKESMNHCCLC